ncbi:hypothetical protein CGZ69_35375 [Streptomyces peucetius subsp. caesius ATCC 27952]|nr:hypothetical protein CGZ69_35375 [Streptomyces peucetius subsp. caesius ATCC 27952]
MSERVRSRTGQPGRSVDQHDSVQRQTGRSEQPDGAAPFTRPGRGPADGQRIVFQPARDVGSICWAAGR